MSAVLNNIKDTREKIKETCEKAGRSIDEVTLLAVTKTVDIDQITEAIDYGIDQIGENKVQEFIRKYEVLGTKKDIHWHFIGHLQRNKVKYIVDKVDLIHSVDSIRLAREINKEAKKIGKTVDILVQINIAEEESKFGISVEELNPLLEEITTMDSIYLKGFMAIPPYTKTPEENRKYFRRMYDLFTQTQDKEMKNVDMKILSMGMTNDYEIAIEEGTTIIRVGTGLFGDRNYNRG